MSSLIDNSQRRWDVSKVRDIFNLAIVVEILKIILSRNPHLFRWLWTEERNFIFSVRIAYKLIINAKM